MTAAYTPSPNGQNGNGNGNGKPAVPPQYPDMMKFPDTKPLLDALGATGTTIMSGIITREEYNPDWFWRDGVHIVDQMLRNDGQIAAMREIVELPIRSATWSIKPASEDARDAEIASMIQSALFDEMCYTTASGRKLTQKWDDTLRQILMHIFYGFMVFELNYRIEDGWVKWSRWTPLLPRTVYKWWVGPDTELAGIQQWTWKDYGYYFVDIPADKLLHFARRMEGNNYEGISALRAPYKHWFYKDQFYKIDAIGIERNAVVPPVIELLPGFSTDDAAMAKKIVENVRVNENMGVVTTPGMHFEYPKNQQHYAANTLPSIQHHDVMIARSFLAQFINLGSTETGAYALNQSQMEQFLASLQAYCSYICDVINPEIKRLVDYNYNNVESYPTLECSKIVAQNISDLADIFSKLMTGNNPLIQPTPELATWLLDQVGAPVASQNPVETQNPTSEAAPERPENERSGDRGDEESQNVSPTGARSRGGAGKAAAGNSAASGAGGAVGAGGDGGGAAAAETGGMVEEARLLRETLDAAYGVDAVERGLKFDFNPDQPRGYHGRWVPAGGGHISGSGGAGHHGGEGHPSEHDVSGGAHTGGGSGGTGHGGGGASRGAKKAEKPKSEKPAKTSHSRSEHHELTAEERASRGLKPEAARGEKLKVDEHAPKADLRNYSPYKGGKSRVEDMKNLYGEHQLGNALSHMTQQHLQEAARDYGIASGGTKNELIARITSHATEGRYNGRTGVGAKAARNSATRAKGTKSAKAGKSESESAKVHELTPEERAARGLKPEVDPKSVADEHGTPHLTPIARIEGVRADPFGGVKPDQLVQLYGEHQLAAAMHPYMHETLKEYAKANGITPGRSKDETISRITSHVTEGRYNGRFGSSGKPSAASAHAAKVKRIEDQISKAQARLDSLKAQHAALTGSKSAEGSTKATRSRGVSHAKPEADNEHARIDSQLGLLRHGDNPHEVWHAFGGTRASVYSALRLEPFGGLEALYRGMGVSSRSFPKRARGETDGQTRDKWAHDLAQRLEAENKASSLAELEAEIEAETIRLSDLMAELENV